MREPSYPAGGNWTLNGRTREHLEMDEYSAAFVNWWHLGLCHGERKELAWEAWKAGRDHLEASMKLECDCCHHEEAPPFHCGDACPRCGNTLVCRG